MRGQRFGASSEQMQTLTEQLYLFNEVETLADDKAAEPKQEQITYKRRKQVGKREMDLSKLPTEQVVHELQSEERVCPECGGPLHRCGQSVLRRELVVEHIQAAYSYRHCEQTNDHVPMKKSEVPAPLLPGGGIVTPSQSAGPYPAQQVCASPAAVPAGAGAGPTGGPRLPADDVMF